MPRVLHVLAQQPRLTGSGVTLDAVVRQAARAGWHQRVVVGLPIGQPRPDVGGIGVDNVAPLRFETGSLDFPLPGMSDVMPYRSSRFSDLSESQLAAYRTAWARHSSAVIADFRPDLIDSHHLWILSGMLRDVAPDIPIVTRSHATGLRQMRLCPHLAEEVRTGCARNDRFLALDRGNAAEIVRELGVDPGRVRVIGSGYREDAFHARGRARTLPPRIAFVGKFAAAKGLPWLLDAMEQLTAARPEVRLVVVGSGSGEKAEALRARMQAMDCVEVLGLLDQARLGDVLRSCPVFVLPSLFEGVPLVVAEAIACGCRAVVTDLPGVRDELAPHLGEAIETVPLPRLQGVDTPDPRDLPDFVAAIRTALVGALDRPLASPPPGLARFGWNSVFQRTERVWYELIGRGPDVTGDDGDGS